MSNKRQRKKNQKKQEMFIASFVSSYRELKEIERSEHEWFLSERRKKHDFTWDVDFEEFEAAYMKNPET